MRRTKQEENEMAEVKSPKELEMRLVQLRDPDWNVRYIAARALVRIGEEAVDSLVLLLEEDDHYLRGQAAKCLGAIGHERAVVPLLNRLTDSNGAVRQEAVRALIQIGHSAVPALLSKVSDPSPLVRRAAIQALASIRDASTRLTLEAIAKDLTELPAIRWEAKLAMNRLRERARTRAM
jgi:HEAT repeat protein